MSDATDNRFYRESYTVTANSATLAALAAALSAAQGEITAAAKDTENPFFHRRYADLASVWDACRAPLAKNGLSVIQCPTADGASVTVHTTLLHSSGEYITSSLSITSQRQTRDGGGWEVVSSPQAIGSTITYARRYALAAMVGVAPDDDDGEAAQGRGATTSPNRAATVRERTPQSQPRPVAPPAERFAQRVESIAAKAEPVQAPLPIARPVPPPGPEGITLANTAPLPWRDRATMEADFADVRATVGDKHFFYILQVHDITHSQGEGLHGKASKLKEAFSVLKLRAAEIATGEVEGAAI